MEFLTGMFVLVLVGIVADSIVKVTKARSGGNVTKALRGELDELTQQVQDQAAALADAQAMSAIQADQIQELAERVDFAERMLAQAREKGLLGRGSGA